MRMEMQMTFPIEKNVPMPRHRRSNNYNFSEMDVGDSFFVPASNDMGCAKTQNSLCNSTRTIRKKHPDRRFETHVVTEEGVAGVRCWRVE